MDASASSEDASKGGATGSKDSAAKSGVTGSEDSAASRASGQTPSKTPPKADRPTPPKTPKTAGPTPPKTPPKAAGPTPPRPPSEPPAKPVMPGVSLMRGHLDQALGERSRTSLPREQDRVVARQAKDELRGIKAPSFRLAAEEKASEPAKEEGCRRALQEKVQDSAFRRWKNILARSDREKKAGLPGLSKGGITLSARGWTRFAFHREDQKAQFAGERAFDAASSSSKAPPDARESWRKYRRDQEEWVPPPDPRFAKSKTSKRRKIIKHEERTAKSRPNRALRKAARLCLCDREPTSPKGVSAAQPVSSRLGEEASLEKRHKRGLDRKEHYDIKTRRPGPRARPAAREAETQATQGLTRKAAPPQRPEESAASSSNSDTQGPWKPPASSPPCGHRGKSPSPAKSPTSGSTPEIIKNAPWRTKRHRER